MKSAEREMLKEAVTEAYPDASEILMTFPDSWELVEVLPPSPEGQPLYIASLPVEKERISRDHFAGLPPEGNLDLTDYRLYRFFEPLADAHDLC
jgi:hypothetical protein